MSQNSNLPQKCNDRVIQHGLQLNLDKREFLTTDPYETEINTARYRDLPRTERFNKVFQINAFTEWWNCFTHKYNLDHRIFYDRHINESPWFKIDCRFFGPVTLYGSERWLATKGNGCRLVLMETEVLYWRQWPCSHRNEDIHDLYGVSSIVSKLPERRLWLYGHLIHVNENLLAKIELSIEANGKWPKSRQNNN